MLASMHQDSRQLSFDDLPKTPISSVAPSLTKRPSTIEPFTYVLERSPRRKSTIQISVQSDLTIRVVAPMRTGKAQIDAMVHERQAWILKRREEVQKSQLQRLERCWESGERLPYLDEELELRIRAVSGGKLVRAVRKDGWLDVQIPAWLTDNEPIKRVVQKWYGIEAQRVFAQRVLHFTGLMGVQPARVLVRNQSSRWGSCASDGSVRFCWRLILAPRRVLDYVVVHELSHLRHPHHQRSFWACVEATLPNYQELRAELKRDGAKYDL
jgi:predicted metal-dependent hydrolase